ncbi:hypothetical protein SAMN05216597_2929 [Pseudomonas cannabina]|nr:hypothetical protein SAMN05216597_2929 [Pseudomonas cannabina]
MMSRGGSDTANSKALRKCARSRFDSAGFNGVTSAKASQRSLTLLSDWAAQSLVSFVRWLSGMVPWLASATRETLNN